MENGDLFDHALVCYLSVVLLINPILQHPGTSRALMYVEDKTRDDETVKHTEKRTRKRAVLQILSIGSCLLYEQIRGPNDASLCLDQPPLGLRERMGKVEKMGEMRREED